MRLFLIIISQSLSFCAYRLHLSIITEASSMSSQPKSVTIEHLEAAFAGESMAHIKYRYFAKLARAAGAIQGADPFEASADQEVRHVFGHLDLLYPKDQMTPARAGNRDRGQNIRVRRDVPEVPPPGGRGRQQRRRRRVRRADRSVEEARRGNVTARSTLPPSASPRWSMSNSAIRTIAGRARQAQRSCLNQPLKFYFNAYKDYP